MECFSVRRMGLYMKAELIENWKKNLSILLSEFLGIFFIILLFSFQFCRCGSSVESVQGITTIITNSLMFVYLLFLCAMLANVCDDYATKAQRIRQIMLPVTNLEKFVTRILRATVFLTISFFLMACLADFVRILVFPLFFPYSFETIVPLLCKEFGQLLSVSNVSDLKISNDVSMFLNIFFLWILSVFLLGGIVFRKRAFLYTGIIIVLLLILGGMLFNYSIRAFNLQLDFSKGSTIAFSLIMTVLALFNVWLSYRLFCRIPVISRKVIGK